MKKVICLLLAVCALAALPGCGGEVIDYDLVFVNHSDSTIVEVVADFVDRDSGVRNANSSPLKRGESFGFEAGEYPVTLAVYDQIFEDFRQRKLASITIGEAPADGERWYITARDGMNGLVLTADTRWPEGEE